MLCTDSRDTREIAALLTALSPAGVAVAVWQGGETTPELFPGEKVFIEKAVAKRQREFAQGRECARDALSQLGVARGPIVVGPNREPLWPQGVVGSITHCEGLVAAIAGLSGDFGGLGLDGEVADPLSLDVGSQVFTEDEFRTAAETLPSGTDPGKVIFCLKESIYKAVFPRHGVHLDFLDVFVDLSIGAGSFSAFPAGELPRMLGKLDSLAGRYAVSEGLVLAVCTLPAG